MGFTLVEVLVASVLIAVLGLGILGLQYTLSQNQLMIWRSYLSVDEANSNTRSIVRELRTARSGDNGAYFLEKADDQEIIFYSDIDFDKKAEKIKYFLDGTSLKKSVIEPEGYPISYPQEKETLKTLTDNVRNGAAPVFYYYNGNWPADTENNPLSLTNRLSNTRLVKVYLRINTDSLNPNLDYVLESFSQIRMLKENL